jgi:cytochrome c biogenesis protein CcmG/thiol:disulfide interchange protein DsbE
VTRTLKLSGQVIALSAVAGLLALLGWRVTHQVHAPKVGAPAPVFTLRRLSGLGSVDLAVLRGHTVVLNFWASWCIPCKQEATVLQRAWNRYRGKGVVFVGIDFHDAISDGRRFVAAHQLRFAMVEDGSGDITTGRYGVSQVPETYVVDGHGKVALHIVGPIAGGAVTREFQHALAGA